ncbi:alpha/beta fold hydrolase [Rhabdaerophilum sp.]|uniref:alpha/beta fold hydrolase n=1 Tax=Rhabdaerophilum sp. TaxID=2717341 RepID=UPI0038D4A78B
MRRHIACVSCGPPSPTGNVLNLSSLDFSARNFESATLDLAFDVLRVATVLGGTNDTVTQPQGGTGNPTSGIKTPTLFVAGRRDAMYPVEALKRAAEALPNGHFEVLDTAHISVVDDPVSLH